MNGSKRKRQRHTGNQDQAQKAASIGCKTTKRRRGKRGGKKDNTKDVVHSSSSKSFDSGKFSDEAILISDAIRDNEDDLGDKTHKFLRQFRQKLNDSLVIEVLKLVPRPELGVKFFIWAGRQIGYSHRVGVYHALLDRLGFDKNSRVPEHFLRKIREDDKEILGNLLNVLIQKCCRNGFWNAALEELGRLKDFGYKPSKSTYNALILLLLKADLLDTAYLVHREMSDSGFNMDWFTMGFFAQSDTVNTHHGANKKPQILGSAKNLLTKDYSCDQKFTITTYSENGLLRV
ncbi:pentatricopeptide repeat-containing protein At1g06710, mitochondrial-like [Telopea speciosissima]|uniref:pentatricopeptide repeat-containing protein At1g06710, mitochondrial-like n=1 Tax=Telopea speciosissima TaxID=54955 RepID=UPI001CC64AF9|nr:pentatricopeptide repeat-containing protein At1g06710, mitochondrial-like [Telopea speciosissima]